MVQIDYVNARECVRLVSICEKMSNFESKKDTTQVFVWTVIAIGILIAERQIQKNTATLGTVLHSSRKHWPNRPVSNTLPNTHKPMSCAKAKYTVILKNQVKILNWR